MKVRLVVLLIFFGLINAMETAGQLFQEPHRLQYHFSPKVNWLNDPCGMVFLDGEYHLMYQYNPVGTQWGNMSWGHAVSRDMLHWEELPVALFPDAQGQIFSGGAIIDHNNTAGFGAGAMVAIYTSAGANQKQNLAYSLNKGRSWTKYTGNPVLTNPGLPDFRDPQVFWHPESNKWIMTLAVGDIISIYSSPNLKDWTFQSDFGKGIGAHGGVWECPDLFKLTVPGQPEPVWVLMVSINPGSPSGGSGTQYFLGKFNGSTFTLFDEFATYLNQTKILPTGILFEGFEGNTYGNWLVEGQAFGAKPARGSLLNQQVVAGYEGQQLVNSYLGGDVTQGKLTSQAFTIQHDYINFLIGGGNHAGQTEIRLVINNIIVAQATGNNEEWLRWKNWDVKQYKGAIATIQIIDNATGGWGHINVDHIYFANTAVTEDGEKAFWVDYGPDFYAGRSWENQPAQTYERVWLAWMNNWSYAGTLPTTTWRGSMSLPRSMHLQYIANGKLRLLQQPIQELNSLRSAPVSVINGNIKQVNNQLSAKQVQGTRYELQFTLVPGNTTAKTGIQIRKGTTEQTEIGYDPGKNTIYLDRGQSGASFSGNYTTLFNAPMETKSQELTFRIFVDESAVEVFVNEGLIVHTARIFPATSSNKLSFFGPEEVQVKSFNFWDINSVWQTGSVLSAREDRLSDSFVVYPNPAQGTFTIQSPHKIEKVEIFSINGQRLPASTSKTAGNKMVVSLKNNTAQINYLNIFFNGGKNVIKKIMVE